MLTQEFPPRTPPTAARATKIAAQSSHVRVVHSIHFPVSARSFVAPIVQYLGSTGLQAELWYQPDRRLEHIQSAITVPHRQIPCDISPRPLEFARRLRGYRKALRSARPVVLHAHQTRGSFIPLLAGWLERVPIRVYHNHGLPYLGHHGALRLFLRSLERMNMRLATHLLLVSHSNLREAESDGLIPAGRASVLGPGSIVGIDLGEFDPSLFGEQASQAARVAFGIPRDAFVLGYVGRPVKRKGFHRLIEAWQRLNFRPGEAVLLIAGCTAEECRAAGIEPGGPVKALGYVNDLRPFYAAADAVALPSDHEGLGYALLEAAAAGRALIGTDIPGTRCAIIPRETGLLFDPAEPGSLLKAIIECFQNPALRRTWGKQARARVEREFDRRALLEEFRRFYAALGIY